MKRTIKWGWVCATVLVGALALAPEAAANSWAFGAFDGQSQYGAYQCCWSDSYGGVVFSSGSCCNLLENINTHEYSLYWEVYLPVQSTGGTFTPTTYVYGSLNQSISCIAVAGSDNQGTINATATQTVTSGSSSLNFSITVPSSGYLYTACTMGSSPAEWYSVTW